MKTYTHLQPEELSVICALHKLRLSCSAIAEQLNRSPSSISRECRRLARSGQPDAPYTLRAAKADRAQKRRRCAGNARRFSTADPVFKAIKTRLLDQHSPAQVLGRLRREAKAFGPAPRMPSRAALYRLIEPLGWYNRERYPSMRLRRYYTRSELAARAERAPKSGVAQCPSVEQRPAYLTKRTLALCMEIDTIVGRKSDHARLVVAVCRRTRYTLIGWLKHGTAAAVEDWVRTRMREQHLPLVCLNSDQGSEFARLPTSSR